VAQLRVLQLRVPARRWSKTHPSASALVRAKHVNLTSDNSVRQRTWAAWATSHCVHVHAWHEALHAPGCKACACAALALRDWWQREFVVERGTS
jgi:hypothetical protein